MTGELQHVVEGLSDEAIARIHVELTKALEEALVMHRSGALGDRELNAISIATLETKLAVPFHDPKLNEANETMLREMREALAVTVQ